MSCLLNLKHAPQSALAVRSLSSSASSAPSTSASHVHVQDTGEATGLLLSNLPKSTLPSDIKRFLHTHGSRSQHLSQITPLLDARLNSTGSALVTFRSPAVCASVHASLLSASRPTPGHIFRPLRIGAGHPLKFERMHPPADVTANGGLTGPRSVLVDRGSRFGGRLVKLEGLTEEVSMAQVLGLVRATGVEAVVDVPTPVKPAESVHVLPWLRNTRRPVFFLRFGSVAEAYRVARELHGKQVSLHQPYHLSASVVW